jgi:hypothetical protein
MKYRLTIVLLFQILMGAACDQATPIPVNGNEIYTDEETDAMTDTLLIKVGGKEFKASLVDNPTTSAFKAMLPLTIDMRDLNSNEKFFDFTSNLPVNASNPGTINSGDIMLWGSNTLVLFYKTFSTTYSYTRIGRIKNPTGLSAVLGTGNARVVFTLQN